MLKVPYLFTYKPSLAISRDPKLVRHDSGRKLSEKNRHKQLLTEVNNQSLAFIMPKARRSSYNMAFKLKVVAEAEAVENNSEIAREYGLSESMVRRWRRDQAKLFNGELKMSAKRTTMGRFTPKYPELDQQILEWFTEQRDQGE